LTVRGSNDTDPDDALTRCESSRSQETQTMTCTVSEVSHQPDGRTLTLYYDSNAECSLADTTPVSDVYIETDSTAVITFYPLTGASTPDISLAAYCGSGNTGSYTKTDLNPPGDGSVFKLTFGSSVTNGTVWGWDFEAGNKPPPLTVKVRVKRI
jgi:hypothetical protein